ncbi:unannotated protein [freshwater metagenome]|uniref:Unannotated protein n=1 Tax=freshwater metagenome TaxID=449393 RepID=A0A6J7JPF9_9ZZZZ
MPLVSPVQVVVVAVPDTGQVLTAAEGSAEEALTR